MIKVTISGNYSKNIFTQMLQGEFSPEKINKLLLEAGAIAQKSMEKTSLHNDISGLGRKSYKTIKSRNQSNGVEVINTATNKGFYYMPHIDRGGRAGKGGYIQARKFSEQAVITATQFFKSKRVFKK